MPTNAHLTCFASSKRSRRQFQAALVELLSQEQLRVQSQFISAENTFHFQHGQFWSFGGEGESQKGVMKAHSAEYHVPFQKLIDADLSLISESLSSIAEQMQKSFMRQMYVTVSDACDRSGNVVADTEFEVALLQSLRKLELSVDAEGKVNPPQLHMHPNELIKIQSLTQATKDEMEAIFQEKSRAAREQEAVRRRKFTQSDP